MEDILDIEEQIVKGSWAKRHPFRVGLITVGFILMMQFVVAKLMMSYEFIHFNTPTDTNTNTDYYKALRTFSYVLAASQLLVPNLVFMLLARSNQAWQSFEYLSGKGFWIAATGTFLAMMLLFAHDVSLIGLLFVTIACAATAGTLGSFSSALLAMIFRKDGL